MRSADIRAQFLAYFASRGHEIVPSSSLVPKNDPTLLFANAGMNQFKDVFVGREKRATPRAASSQKCVRAGGKHNDLENVGRTARHHTFFEMLGNFSFGDYFKEGAIAFAWQLLTSELGIAPARLMVTVFGGEDGVAADDEARELWRRIASVPDERILALGKADNFWAMGEQGPCGPCSEIHYHQGDDLPCAAERAGGRCAGPACDCDRWLEIWNLVFMQFERREAGGALVPLPRPSIDTGMGLERLAAVLQGKRTNYETDCFATLIDRAAAVTKTRFVPSDFEGESVSLRAIADHARATTLLIADGVQPDKNGREYVLRRIMRRAIYHGFLLGAREAFLHGLCEDVIGSLGAVFPELVERRRLILETVQHEEARFRETLDRGVKFLDAAFQRGEKAIAGDAAFKLYDTYGFPLDLTRVIAERRGVRVDEAGFERAMEQQRDRSGAFPGSGAEAEGEIWKTLAQRLPRPEFLGYGEHGGCVRGQGRVLAIVAGGREVERGSAADGQVWFVTDRTPFYGEQGGQAGDAGTARGEGVTLRVLDARKPSDLTVHVAEITSGELRIGDSLALEVDAPRREAIRRNHSATHLLHLALRQVLGEHATQKGSLVAPDRLRFDFSHFAPVTPAERARLELLVNQRVLGNAVVDTAELALEEARQRGAIAFFGEKYGDRVRVVEMADSKELCGGTHVGRTGDIGFFKITSELGIAQGVRRIEAVTGEGAVAYVAQLEAELASAAEALRSGLFDVGESVLRVQRDLRERAREVDALKAKLAGGGGRDLMSQVREVAGLRVLATRSEVGDPKALREVGDQLRDRLGPSAVVVLGGVDGEKVSIVAMVGKEAVGKVKAGDLVRELSAIVGGKGGGRPDMAQGGGSLPDKLDEALSRVEKLVGGP